MLRVLSKLLPPPQPRDLTTLKGLIQGKSVALVGNATSLFRKFRDIDSHDIVVRINKGPYILDKEGRAGRRTDVLLISGLLGETFLNAAPHVVWMTPKNRNRLGRREIRRMYFYPIEWWQELTAVVGARPSTGCMGIDLISRIIGEGEIFLYGFDFWRTPTVYTGKIKPGPHNPVAEEEFARSRVKPENIVA